MIENKIKLKKVGIFSPQVKYPVNEFNSVTNKEEGEYLHFLRLYYIPGAVSPDADEVQPGYPHTSDQGGVPNKELLRGKILTDSVFIIDRVKKTYLHK